MKKVIVATHAGMARGMKETAEFIAGSLPIEAVCCFTEEEHLDKYIARELQSLGENDKLIVMTDIKVGSVNQMWAALLNSKVYLISGFNLPLLLDIALADEESITGQFIRNSIKEAKNEMVFMNEELEKADFEEEECFF